jgi:hypothetical protein
VVTGIVSNRERPVGEVIEGSVKSWLTSLTTALHLILTQRAAMYGGRKRTSEPIKHVARLRERNCPLVGVRGTPAGWGGSAASPAARDPCRDGTFPGFPAGPFHVMLPVGGRETVEVLKALAGAPNKLPVLLGNSGVGKSSVAQAGVLAALKRQAWPEKADMTSEWPLAFRESRHWCFLTLKPGTEPLKALVEAFLDTWQLGSTDPERVKQQNGWIELLLDGKAMLRDLLDASERRYTELDRTEPPAFLLYVDQGEELYVRAEERPRRRFLEVIAQGVVDPRLYALMSMRSDFLGELQKDEPLYKVRLQIDVPPLREPELREVVSRELP